MPSTQKREVLAGLVVAVFGALAAVKGSSYQIGTLADMGPGLFPVMIGVAMMVVGGLIAAAAPAGAAHEATVPVDLRVWACVLAGAGLFIGLSQFAGLLPAIFLSVFVSAWADRATTLRGSLMLAACVSAFGIGLFTYVLHVQLPILGGV